MSAFVRLRRTPQRKCRLRQLEAHKMEWSQGDKAPQLCLRVLPILSQQLLHQVLSSHSELELLRAGLLAFSEGFAGLPIPHKYTQPFYPAAYKSFSIPPLIIPFFLP